MEILMADNLSRDEWILAFWLRTNAAYLLQLALKLNPMSLPFHPHLMPR